MVITGLQEEHEKTNCVQDRSIQHPAVQGQQEEDTVTKRRFRHDTRLEVEVDTFDNQSPFHSIEF